MFALHLLTSPCLALCSAPVTHPSLSRRCRAHPLHSSLTPYTIIVLSFPFVSMCAYTSSTRTLPASASSLAHLGFSLPGSTDPRRPGNHVTGPPHCRITSWPGPHPDSPHPTPAFDQFVTSPWAGSAPDSDGITSSVTSPHARRPLSWPFDHFVTTRTARPRRRPPLRTLVSRCPAPAGPGAAPDPAQAPRGYLTPAGSQPDRLPLAGTSPRVQTRTVGRCLRRSTRSRPCAHVPG